MKTTKKAALAAASSALLLGLTVAQTTDADSYTVQNEDLFFLITSQGYAVGSISAARSIVCWTGGGYQIRWFCYTSWLDSNLGVEL